LAWENHGQGGSEMAKINVITDAQGNLLGAVRTGPFKTSNGKHLEFRPHPHYKHHIADVDDKLPHGPASELGKFLRAQVK
jgi:hypothetical protein